MKSLMLTLLLAATSFGADLAGKWSGTAEMMRNGETRSSTAVLIFKMDGEKLTGTGGRDESQQTPLDNIKVDGNKLAFEVADGDVVVKVALEAAGDAMTGEARAERDGQTMTVKFNLQRQK